MRFLDIIISPFSWGDSSTAIFAIGLCIIALICGATTALLVFHFRKERNREEKRKEKQTVRTTDDP